MSGDSDCHTVEGEVPLAPSWQRLWMLLNSVQCKRHCRPEDELAPNVLNAEVGALWLPESKRPVGCSRRHPGGSWACPQKYVCESPD